MTAFEVLLIAAEDVLPGDWIGEPAEQGRVASIKRLPITGKASDALREEWPDLQIAEGVQIYVVSAKASVAAKAGAVGEARHLVVGRSLVALVGEPIRVTRSVALVDAGTVQPPS